MNGKAEIVRFIRLTIIGVIAFLLFALLCALAIKASS